MNEETLLNILDAIPYPLVFVDTTHTIRYMNTRAEEYYCEEHEYGNLIGRSVLDCHNRQSIKKIKEVFERLTEGGEEELLTTGDDGVKTYMTPVRDKGGKLVGYFERYDNIK